DLASRSLFLDAVVSGPNNLIFSLNVDTGATNAGWPVDVNASVSGFSSSIQSQRAALGILGSKVYVPYGGYFGDAGSYRGRLVGTRSIIQAAATYRTATATYVVFRPGTGTLTAFKITATNPPTIATGWTVSSSGRGSPFVTSTDGTNNVIVWAVGSSGDQRLHG